MVQGSRIMGTVDHRGTMGQLSSVLVFFQSMLHGYTFAEDVKLGKLFWSF